MPESSFTLSASPQSPRTGVPLRVLSGIGGVLVLLTSALFTLGTSLAAPLGMLAGRSLARRRGRRFTRASSWFAAAVASSVAVLLGFALVFASIPEGTFREIQKEAASAQARDTVQLPEWMARVFPQAARPDPVTQELVNSPAFTLVFGILGFVIGCAFLGTIAGSAGWLGATLLSYAIRGRRPAQDASSEGRFMGRAW